MSPAFRIALAVAALAFGTHAQAAQRVFVASYGSDANTATQCVFATPCRSFSSAMLVVDPGGEIIALDAAGYGPVNTHKSVTITANPGVYAGIAASALNAVTIATPGVDVVLRGLTLNGVGATHGIYMANGASLTVENCVVSNFTEVGILAFTQARVRITDTVVRSNANGIALARGATGSLSNVRVSHNEFSGLAASDQLDGMKTQLTVSDSDISGNQTGVRSQASTATGGARVTVLRSSIANNSVGFTVLSLGPGVDSTGAIGASSVSENVIGLNNAGTSLESQGNNFVRSNGTNSIGTITNVGSY